MKNNIKQLIESYFDDDELELQSSDIEDKVKFPLLILLSNAIDECGSAQEEPLKEKALPILEDIYNKNKKMFKCGKIKIEPIIVYEPYGNGWLLTLSSIYSGKITVTDYDWRGNLVRKRKNILKTNTFCYFWDKRVYIPGYENFYRWHQDAKDMLNNVKNVFNLKHIESDIFEMLFT